MKPMIFCLLYDTTGSGLLCDRSDYNTRRWPSGQLQKKVEDPAALYTDTPPSLQINLASSWLKFIQAREII